MLTTLSILVFACLSKLKCEALNTDGPLKLASAPGSKIIDDPKDLDVSASSNHAFLLSRDYGYGGNSGGSGGYGGRHDSTYDNSFGEYPSVGEGSVYRSGSTYRGSGLTPGRRGYQGGGYEDEIIGGGHTGYGYYGISSAYGSRHDGYGTGGQDTYGGSGSRLHNPGYLSYGGTGGGDGGYGDGYGDGYGGSYSGGYGEQDTTGYDSYGYRGNGGHVGNNGYGRYGGYGYQPSGYRGYS